MVLKINKNGNREWFNKNGKRYRLNGPAVEYINGRKEWYIKGIKYTEEQYCAQIKNR